MSLSTTVSIGLSSALDGSSRAYRCLPHRRGIAAGPGTGTSRGMPSDLQFQSSTGRLPANASGHRNGRDRRGPGALPRDPLLQGYRGGRPVRLFRTGSPGPRIHAASTPSVPDGGKVLPWWEKPAYRPPRFQRLCAGSGGRPGQSLRLRLRRWQIVRERRCRPRPPGSAAAEALPRNCLRPSSPGLPHSRRPC